LSVVTAARRWPRARDGLTARYSRRRR
jgi:hypothetical protein